MSAPADTDCFPATATVNLENEKVLACYDARRVHFDGKMNCRDLGGLPTADGGSTVSARLYRAGRLANLNEDDKSRFRALGVKHTVDLRLPFERENYPNPDAAVLGIEEHRFGYLPDGAMDMFNAINDGTITPDGIRTGMCEQYRLMATAHPDVYRGMFETLLANDEPALFHCSGGKDRTGVASAIILRIAGVSREVVVADYLLTNLDVPQLGVLTGDVDPELAAVVGFAHTELIDCALDAIENEFDDYADFVINGIGLSANQYKALRQRFLA